MNLRSILTTVACVIILIHFGCKSNQGPVAPPPTGGIEACFTHSAENGHDEGKPVTFDASCSTDDQFRINEYTWDWGDGSEP